MNKSALRIVQGFVTAILLLLAPNIASADSYPTRLVKIVVPVPPGTTADTLPRLIAEKLEDRWRVPVVIENRPGAANNLGAQVVARAEPDGYTLLATPQGPLVISQSFYPKLGFDPDAFVPITVFAAQPLLLVVNAKSPISSLEEFVNFARTNPDKLNFGSPGAGSSPHLTGEMLRIAAGIGMVHVPYRGLGAAMTDLLAGNIDVVFDNLSNTFPHIAEGRLRALGVAGRERIPELPGIPAIAEAFPDFYASSWFAFVAPPKTPAAIAEKISRDIADALRSADVAEKYRALSITPVGSSPSQTATFLQQESARWRRVIESAGIKGP